ncbi:MAG: ATP-binding protein [Proteobacteria bacterium]|nr:ATP-binding protein [Pseudomonadota bacterium]
MAEHSVQTAMYVSIRTTIFWNILLLMIAAIALISFVVFRVTEREMIKQRIRSGEETFYVLSSVSAHTLNTDRSSAHPSEVQHLMQRLAGLPLFSRIILINNDHVMVAHSEQRLVGKLTADTDLLQALLTSEVNKKVSFSGLVQGKYLTVCGPLYNQEHAVIGALKVVFPLADVDQQIAKSERIILFYILFDAAVLILFGTYLLSRYLVKPIDKIIKLTDTIARGDLDATLYLSERNEIGKLSAALTRMAESLQEEKRKVQEHIHTLEDKNRELYRAQQESIQSEKLASVGRLAAGIAHEIGNPIGIILGYLHLLLNQQVDEEEKTDYLKRMNAETERINAIIRELLDYAQPSALQKAELDLNKIIEETYALVSYQKGFQRITVTVNLEPDMPGLYADEKQIRQIIINLTLNALDALPVEGTINYTTAYSPETEHILFSITDTGAGIPENLQQKVFDPFFTTKEPGKGTGLGLSNVQRIVDALGGTVTVVSDPGKGTTFTILFPVVKKTILETTSHEC